MIHQLREQARNPGADNTMDPVAVKVLATRTQQLESTLIKLGITHGAVKPDFQGSGKPMNSASLSRLLQVVPDKAQEHMDRLQTTAGRARDYNGVLSYMGEKLGVCTMEEQLKQPMERPDLENLTNAFTDKVDNANRLEAENTELKTRLAGLAERLGNSPEGLELQAILEDANTSDAPNPSVHGDDHHPGGESDSPGMDDDEPEPQGPGTV